VRVDLPGNVAEAGRGVRDESAGDGSDDWGSSRGGIPLKSPPPAAVRPGPATAWLRDTFDNRSTSVGLAAPHDADVEPLPSAPSQAPRPGAIASLRCDRDGIEAERFAIDRATAGCRPRCHLQLAESRSATLGCGGDGDDIIAFTWRREPPGRVSRRLFNERRGE
jgi:hypothetical protein